MKGGTVDFCRLLFDFRNERNYMCFFYVVHYECSRSYEYSKNRIYIIFNNVLISDSKNDLYARLKRGHSSIVPFTDAVVPPLYFIFEK